MKRFSFEREFLSLSTRDNQLVVFFPFFYELKEIAEFYRNRNFLCKSRDKDRVPFDFVGIGSLLSPLQIYESDRSGPNLFGQRARKITALLSQV